MKETSQELATSGEHRGCDGWCFPAGKLGQGWSDFGLKGAPARHGPRELEQVTGDVTGWIIEWDGQRRGAIYVSGDTVLFEELQEIPQRYRIGTALLHFGAARFDVFGPVYLTFTAAEGASFATALGEVIVMPLHYEGWAHLTEGRAQIEQAFVAAGLEQRLRFLPLGQPVPIDA